MNKKSSVISLEEKSRQSLNWSTASNVLSKLIMPITNMVLARLLAKDIFGIVASINIVISLAEIFADSGFSKYLVQADFENEEHFDLHKSVSFWTNTIISLIMLLFIVIFKDSLATLIGSQGYGLALAIAAIQIPIYGFSSISTALLRRNFEFKKLFFVRMLGVVITLAGSVIFALLKYEHWALIIGSLLSIVFQTIVLFIISKFKPKFTFSFSTLKQIISFSINSFLEAILTWVATSLVLVFINLKLGNDASGEFKMAGNTLNGILNMFTAIFIPVLFSNLSRQKTNDNGFDETFLNYQASAAYIIIPAVIGIVLFTPVIVNLFLGSDWKSIESFIGYLAIGKGLIILFRSFPTTYFLAKGNPEKSVWTQLIWLLIYLPFSYFIISQGLDFYVKIGLLLDILLCIITYLWFKISYKISLKKTILILIKPIVVSIPMIGIALVSYNISTNLFFQLAAIIFCVVTYFGTFFLVFKKDFKMLLNLFFSKKTN